MIIRKLESDDIYETVELWYETSIHAHSFISSDYWGKNKKLWPQYIYPIQKHTLLWKKIQ
jgi:hypothetical protein